jgi:tetratricopeptide (TPR) repeat protein
MKKIIGLIYFFTIIQVGSAQNKNNDTSDNPLQNPRDPIEKFSLIVKRSEKKFVTDGGSFDSSSLIQLLQIAQQSKNDSLLAISYNWIGSYLAFAKGDNVAALEYYFKAIPLAEKVNDKRRISSLYFDIALIYFALEDNDKAGENIRKGGENLPDRSSPMFDFMLVQYQRNMAQYYLNARQPDSALHYAQATLETSHHLKSISFEHGALYLSGDAYAQMGDKEMAEISFKKALALNDSIRLNSTKVPFFTGYVSFLLSAGKVPEAYQQARELLGIAIKDNNDNIKLAADSLLRKVFDSMHHVDSAYYYLKLETNISASIFSHNNINKVQSLAFNEQLRSIEEKAKQAEENKKRKENIQYVLIALGIISLVILYLLLSRSFITNSKLIEFFGVIALLIIFEFLNLLLHPFLETITRHTPIFMLLSLVCIAALLVPLHHKLEKWATTKLIEKNKKIRLATAKRTIEQLNIRSENL